MSRLRICLAWLFLLVLAACSDDKKEQQAAKQPEQAPPLPVEVLLAREEKVPIWLEYTGKTEATQRIEIQARVAGRLEQVHFNEGDIVEKDQVLFTIEKDSYQAEVAKAKAAMQKNRASLALANADVERYKPLVAEGLAPRATLEQYVARQQELLAAIQADEAAIRDAELNLSYTDVLAPAGGRISRRLVDVGNIVGYGNTTVLTTIIADDPIYVYFNPTEEEFQLMQRFRSSDRMAARVRVPDTMASLLNRPHFSGHVDFTDNRVDPLTGTISMRALINNPEHRLLEGTFVYTEIFLTDQQAFIMVPPNAVMDDQQGSFVFIADKDDTVKRADIERGFVSRYFLTVREGLPDGSRVIINGLGKLRPGQKVEPADVTATKGILAVMAEKGLMRQ